MLDQIANRNFVWIWLIPYLKGTPLGIDLFDCVFADIPERFTFMDETLWVPQHPGRPEFGSAPCKICGRTGSLKESSVNWIDLDTRKIRFTE